MPDYVVFGTAAWTASWLTDQNLAAALADRHRVLYIEPPITPLTPLRGGRWRDLRDLGLWRPRVVERGVRAVRPIVLPPLTAGAARRLSQPLLRLQARWAARRAGVRQPVVLAASWSSVGLEGALRERLRVALVKDLVAAGADLLGRDAASIAEDQRRQLVTADLVVATSPALAERLRADGFDAAIVRHGFAGDLAAHFDEAVSAPPVLRELARPILLYAGTIDDRLAFEALDAVAREHPRGTVLLVGPVSPRMPADRLATLHERPNVEFLPACPRSALPRLLRHVDCCLLPYRETEWLRHAAPLKLWDYLYAGPPIAGSGCDVLSEYPPPLVHSGPSEDLARNVRKALDSGGAGAADRRRLALENTWDHRAAELDSLVAEELAQSQDRRSAD